MCRCSLFRAFKHQNLTLTPLTWRISQAANNASRWQMGFNSAFKGLKSSHCQLFKTLDYNLRSYLSYRWPAFYIYHFSIFSKGKDNAIPLQAWSGPEGSRKLRFPDFMTTQDGCKVVSLKHRPPLPPGNAPGTHFC